MKIILDEKLTQYQIESPTTHADFIDNMVRSNYDYKTGMTTKTHLPAYNNIPTDKIYHQSYMSYLGICWNHHLGVVISPDIIWQGLLCEIAQIVSKNPDRYRDIFSESVNKQELVVVTDELVVMPLDTLIELLIDKVPGNSDLFLPTFNTTTERSMHAFSAAFCDICSPYYNYSMLLCGIPFVSLEGTKEDWEKLLNCWDELDLLLKTESKFFQNVRYIIGNIINQFIEVDVEFWKKMFSLKKCGSGSQVLVDGWIEKLFLEVPKIKYPKNYATHISSVKYKQLNTGKNYDMRVGLFFSNLDGQLLVPDFGFSVLEVLNEPIKIPRMNKGPEMVCKKVDGNSHRTLEDNWIIENE